MDAPLPHDRTTWPPVLHLATPEAWDEACRAGRVAPPSLVDEGFVHCSTPDQAVATTARHFAGHDRLVVLVIDVDAVAPDLRWAESHPGEWFPHVHAAIPLEAVRHAVPWDRAPDGVFPPPVLPA